MTKAVAYYRVSTTKQGATGNGLEAQKADVEKLCKVKGWEIIAPPFTEIESGKRDDRRELANALARCRQTGAILVVAKLDRLSRNIAFLTALQESGAKFIAADMPEANELTIHIMAAVAQAERKMISQRTKDALAAVKARGEYRKPDGTPYKAGNRLGNPNGAAAFKGRNGSVCAVETLKRKADEHAALIQPVIERLRAEGHSSLGALARQLNAEGMRTPRGATWHPTSVKNLLARF